jgi:hypothetical protein
MNPLHIKTNGLGYAYYRGELVKINYKTYGGLKRAGYSIDYPPTNISGYFDEDLKMLFIFELL